MLLVTVLAIEDKEERQSFLRLNCHLRPICLRAAPCLGIHFLLLDSCHSYCVSGAIYCVSGAIKVMSLLRASSISFATQFDDDVDSKLYQFSKHRETEEKERKNPAVYDADTQDKYASLASTMLPIHFSLNWD